MYKCTYIPNDHAFVAMKIYYDSNKKKICITEKKNQKNTAEKAFIAIVLLHVINHLVNLLYILQRTCAFVLLISKITAATNY